MYTCRYNPKKIKVAPLLLTIFVIFSSFYLTSIKVPNLGAMSYSPVYYWGILGTALFMVISSAFEWKIFDSRLLIFYVCLFYYSVPQILNNGASNMIINTVFSYLYFLIVLYLSKKTELKNLHKIVLIFLLSSIVLLIIESFLRIKEFDTLYFKILAMIGGTNDFYSSKTGSIMFADSNSTAFLSGTVLLLLVYLKKYKMVYLKFALLVITILTFSRSAMFALIIICIISYFRKIRILTVVSLLVILPTSYYILNINLIEYFLTDGSFLTKIDILRNTVLFVNNANFSEFLFGIGFGNAQEYIGIWAHNYFVTYFIETGVIGLILNIIMLVKLLSMGKYENRYLLLFLAITGLSFVPYTLTYFFVANAIIIVLENRKKRVSPTLNIGKNEVMAHQTQDI